MDNYLLTKEQRENFNIALKRGILKQLFADGMLSNIQLYSVLSTIETNSKNYIRENYAVAE